jgi:hypothetical protein
MVPPGEEFDRANHDGAKELKPGPAELESPETEPQSTIETRDWNLRSKLMMETNNQNLRSRLMIEISGRD